MMFTFNPSIDARIDGQRIVVDDEYTRRVVSLVAHGTDAERLHAAMREPAGADAETMRFVRGLAARRILIAARQTVVHDERRARSLGYLSARTGAPADAQAKLDGLRVMLLGVGGTGSVALQHLVAAGIRRFTVVDNDAVELSNFNRQMIWQTLDVGQSKVGLAKQWVDERVDNPDVQTEKAFVEHDGDVAALLRIHPSDVLVCCIDTPDYIERVVMRAATDAGVPAVSAGVGLHSGHVGPMFLPGSDVCEACWFRDDPRERHMTRWSHAVTNTLIGALLAQRVIDWVIDPSVDDLPRRQTIRFDPIEVTERTGGICADGRHNDPR